MQQFKMHNCIFQENDIWEYEQFMVTTIFVFDASFMSCLLRLTMNVLRISAIEIILFMI